MAQQALVNRVAEILWDSLKHDPEHADRRQTGVGTKTKIGLAATLERAVLEEQTSPTVREAALAAALREAWSLLQIGRVAYVIQDGGKGNLGEQALYQAALRQAQEAIKPFGRL